MFENFGAVHIEGIIIAVCILARVLVHLTPTKEDDKWLDKNLPKWQWWLAKIFGLDLRQGRKKFDK